MKSKLDFPLTILGFFLVIGSAFLYQKETSTYIVSEIGELFKYLCIFESCFAFFIYIILKIVTKSYHDKDKNYSVRIMVSFHFSFVLILSIISIYFSMSFIPVVLLILSELIFIYVLWNNTPKIEILQ